MATDPEELPRLEKIHERGIANGIEDLRRITAGEIKAIEPHCTGIAGLWVGCTGIIDFRGAPPTRWPSSPARINPASEVHTGEEVLATSEMRVASAPYAPRKASHLRQVRHLLRRPAERSPRRADGGARVKERIVGFRGDYYELSRQGKHKVRNLIYPVPDPRFPFLGVHFTRMTDGGIECGPNAVFAFKREGYGKTDFSFRDTWEALYLWRYVKLFFKNFSYGVAEYRRAFSKRLVPEDARAASIPIVGHGGPASLPRGRARHALGH